MMERIFPTINRRMAGMAIAILAATASIALWVGNTKLIDPDSFLGATALNIASLLDARSPGERTKAELSKSKGASESSDALAEPADVVSERVLGKIFPAAENDHLVVTPEELIALIPLGVPLSEVPGGDVAPIAQTFLSGPLAARGGGFGPSFISGGSSGGGGSVGGDSGGGGGSGDVGGGQTPTPPELLPAVPEPSTWVLMLMGAAMCGASMRRQKRLQRQAMA